MLKFPLVHKIHIFWNGVPEPHELLDSSGYTTKMTSSSITCWWKRKSGEQQNTLRERLHPNLHRPSLNLVQIPLSDDAMMMISYHRGERQRQRFGSRDRVHLHVQVPQKPQIQPIVTPESDDEISDEDFTIILHLHQLVLPPSVEQRNRSWRFGRSRSRERLRQRLSSHASQ